MRFSRVVRRLLPVNVDAAPARRPQPSVYPRNWNETEYWCSLCCEPVNIWSEHLGKREHVVLEMFFLALANQPRCWDPSDVLKDYLLGRATERVKRPPYDALLRHYDVGSELPRRTEVFRLGQYLLRNGMFDVVGASSVLRGLDQWHGSMVLFKELHAPVLRLFPTADQCQLSALTQMLSSSFNLETVFELCKFEEFFPIDPAKNVRMANGSPLTFSIKSATVRGILGRLRWSAEPESMAEPPNLLPHLSVVADIFFCHIVCELIFCRFSEYVARVERVWQVHTEHVAPTREIQERLINRRCSNFGLELLMNRRMQN